MSERPAHPAVARFIEDMRAEALKRGINPNNFVVEDTGDTGEGGEPIVLVKVLHKGHQCLVMVHLTESTSSLLSCEPMPEKQSRT